MKKKILLTGITGFVGRHTARAILGLGLYDVTAIVRPNTDSERLEEFAGKVEIVEIDLCDLIKLRSYLKKVKFDAILHIGAVLGNSSCSKKDIFAINSLATKLLADSAKKNKSKFIFCSTVGVLGTVPKNIPACEEMLYMPDNVYHTSKVMAERYIRSLEELNYYILRPTTIYGEEDRNFPYKLIDYVCKRRMFFVNNCKIHLLDVETLSVAFLYVLNNNLRERIFQIADIQCVSLNELCGMIKMNLPKGNFWIVPNFLKFFLKLFLFVKKEFYYKVLTVFESRSYDCKKFDEHFAIKRKNTLDSFDRIVKIYVEGNFENNQNIR